MKEIRRVQLRAPNFANAWMGQSPCYWACKIQCLRTCQYLFLVLADWVSLSWITRPKLRTEGASQRRFIRILQDSLPANHAQRLSTTIHLKESRSYPRAKMLGAYWCKILHVLVVRWIFVRSLICIFCVRLMMIRLHYTKLTMKGFVDFLSLKHLMTCDSLWQWQGIHQNVFLLKWTDSAYIHSLWRSM